MPDIRISLLLGALAMGADSSAALAQASAPARVVMTDVGPLLTTLDGMTLYQHSSENMTSPKFAWLCTKSVTRVMNDQQSGFGDRPTIGAEFQKSCVEKFPPYLASGDAAASGDFTLAQRPDGAKQWAYRGFPLYLSAKDRASGDLNGIPGGLFGGGGGGRFGGFRFALDTRELPAGLKFVNRDQGLVLAMDPGDRLVFTPRREARLTKASAGTAVEDFQPLLAPGLANVEGDWSIITNGTGQRQYAFRGSPLYRGTDALSDKEILQGRDWNAVIVEKSAGMPPGIRQGLSLAGRTYTTRSGRTLYTYSCTAGFGPGPAGARSAAVPCDDAGDPAGYMVSLCGDAKECARRWQPYLAPRNARRVGDWAPIEITYPMFTNPRGTLYPADAPKVRAWANRGRPLFTYYEDEKQGDIWGDGTKGLWGSSFNALLALGEAGALGE
jgi:predicted lipoprotein with Yx(FWY)xxD motif